MKTVQVRLGQRGYPIVTDGRLSALGMEIRRRVSTRGLAPRKALIVTHPRLAGLYLKPVVAGLQKAGIRANLILIPQGESAKTLGTVEKICRQAAREALDRSSCFIALGGGVAGDIAGFAAACYLRGVPVVQVPTTFLAMVDSAIGGKTGVDIPEAKNFVGAFHQPAAVVADLDTLRTLPPRHLRAGLAEVIKYGLIADPALFRLLERRSGAILKLDAELLARVVARCVTLKARVVAADEREAGERMLLNLGHTFGHAIEAATGFVRYLHGEAVGIGLVAASVLAERAGVAAKGLEGRVRRLVRGCGLPDRAPGLDPVRLRARARGDKKVRGGQMRYVVCRRIGKAEVREDLPAWAIASAWRACVTG
ncbi:MAG: 3-dehydroquinate synthase [Candidatus Brocadiae bacterium]|nr:3-dehydroquinate synthase [Candidatus Brocadiia bacterium]